MQCYVTYATRINVYSPSAFLTLFAFIVIFECINHVSFAALPSPLLPWSILRLTHETSLFRIYGVLLNRSELSVKQRVDRSIRYEWFEMESPICVIHIKALGVRFIAQRMRGAYYTFNGFNGFVWRRQHININFNARSSANRMHSFCAIIIFQLDALKPI